MLFLFQMHQDDGGGTLYVEDYSKVKIDDDDDDNDDDDAVSYFRQFCSQSNYEANEHVTPAKD